MMYRLIGIGIGNWYNRCFGGIGIGIGSVKNACNYRSDTDSFKADLTMKMVVSSNKHSKIISKLVTQDYLQNLLVKVQRLKLTFAYWDSKT